MTSKAKIKGNSWERECAKGLSKIFGYNFERCKGSGAFVGGKNSIRKIKLSETQLVSSMADIIPPTEMKNMVVECKFYKDFPFYMFLQNKSIPLIDFWIEQQLDVVDDMNFWFIAFKINRVGSYIVIPEKICNFIDDRIGNHSIYYYNNEKYIVSEFFPFIELYKNEILKKSA